MFALKFKGLAVYILSRQSSHTGDFDEETIPGQDNSSATVPSPNHVHSAMSCGKAVPTDDYCTLCGPSAGHLHCRITNHPNRLSSVHHGPLWIITK